MLFKPAFKMWETQKRTKKMFWIKSTRTPHSGEFLRLVHLHDKNNSQCLTNYWVTLTLWYSCFSIMFLHQLTAAVRKWHSVRKSTAVRRLLALCVSKSWLSLAVCDYFQCFATWFNFCALLHAALLTEMTSDVRSAVVRSTTSHSRIALLYMYHQCSLFTFHSLSRTLGSAGTRKYQGDDDLCCCTCRMNAVDSQPASVTDISLLTLVTNGRL